MSVRQRDRQTEPRYTAIDENNTAAEDTERP